MNLSKCLYGFIFIVFIFSACQSDDGPSINTTLLHGKWYYSNYCKAQNNLELKSDNTYVKTFSGNSCDDNQNDTVQEKGTYALDGDLITFTKISEEIIEEGTGNSGGVPELTVLLYTRISELDENHMVFQSRYKANTEYFQYTEFTKN